MSDYKEFLDTTIDWADKAIDTLIRYVNWATEQYEQQFEPEDDQPIEVGTFVRVLVGGNRDLVGQVLNKAEVKTRTPDGWGGRDDEYYEQWDLLIALYPDDRHGAGYNVDEVEVVDKPENWC